VISRRRHACAPFSKQRLSRLISPPEARFGAANYAPLPVTIVRRAGVYV
jgi:hypothetical protein